MSSWGKLRAKRCPRQSEEQHRQEAASWVSESPTVHARMYCATKRTTVAEMQVKCKIFEFISPTINVFSFCATTSASTSTSTRTVDETSIRVRTTRLIGLSSLRRWRRPANHTSGRRERSWRQSSTCTWQVHQPDPCHNGQSPHHTSQTPCE